MGWIIRLLRRLLERRKPAIDLAVSRQWLIEHKVRTDKKEDE